MTDYIIKRGVPILDEHTLKDDDGRDLVEIDSQRLEDIATRNNKRVSETGDLAPIIIGHTSDDATETDQPEIVGYACNFKVAPFKKTGRKALTADFKFFKDKAHLANKYPRRSVELWLSDWKIDPIALLGATTPERDLGLLQLSRAGRRTLKLQRLLPQDSNPQMNPEEIVQAVIAGLEQTDLFQWVRQKMDEEQAAAAVGPGLGMEPGMDQGADPMMDQGMPQEPPVAGPGDDYDDEDEYVDDDESDEDDDDEDDEEDDEEPVKYEAGCPSGTNTFTPRTKMNRRPQKSQIPPHIRAQLMERIRMSAQQGQTRLSRQDAAIHRLLQENEQIRLKFARAERERDLIQLESEGVMFDRAEELEDSMTMDDQTFQKHVVKMRKRYSKAPVGTLWAPQDTRAKSAPGGRSKDRATEIANYALQKGISYAQALADLEGE